MGDVMVSCTTFGTFALAVVGVLEKGGDKG